MANNKRTTKDLIKIKNKIMMNRINRIQSICNILLDKSSDKKVKTLAIIREHYSQMYDKLLQTGEYEKYKDIEDIIVKEIAKIELYLDQYVYETAHDYEELLFGKIQQIYKSENFQNYINMEEVLKSIEALRDVLKLYGVYISKNEEEKIQQEIQKLKFYTLYRKQVEELIYKNGGKSSNLTRYDNELEKELFCNLLAIKINQIRDKLDLSENDIIFEMSPEKILSDSVALERLIIFDMKKNPYSYINLTKAQMFNAHLCNIGNNPFGQEVYIESNYSFWDNFESLPVNNNDNHLRVNWLGNTYIENNERYGLKTNKVNYSLLKAILSIITDENISILECDKIYEKFGFECRPITLSIGQDCIKMIFDEIKQIKSSQEDIKKELEQENKDDNNCNYCKIILSGIKYDYKEEGDISLLDKLLDRRMIQQPLEVKQKKRITKKQKKETIKDSIQEEQEILQKRKEKVMSQGIITTDIDIIILLVKDLIEKYNNSTNGINYQDISSLQTKIEWLEKLKNKDGHFTLEDTKKLLKFIHKLYEDLNIKHDTRKIMPLEWFRTQGRFDFFNYIEGGEGEKWAPIPERSGYMEVEVSHSFYYGSEYETRSYHNTNPEPLWEKYKKEAKELGIDIKKYYSGFYEENASFETCVNLDDISDLPIDYKKIELIPKDKIEEIINRDEGKEK